MEKDIELLDSGALSAGDYAGRRVKLRYKGFMLLVVTPVGKASQRSWDLLACRRKIVSVVLVAESFKGKEPTSLPTAG